MTWSPPGESLCSPWAGMTTPPSLGRIKPPAVTSWSSTDFAAGEVADTMRASVEPLLCTMPNTEVIEPSGADLAHWSVMVTVAACSAGVDSCAEQPASNDSATAAGMTIFTFS
ncbi:Uncharacterised protein [Mycobacteroides abscessus subsp. abscessus]|nr:Uncharacterised protein [Mycobacteroides abscessus subsp. abscessus]